VVAPNRLAITIPFTQKKATKMKKDISLILGFILVLIVITACSTSSPPKVEITRIIPQPVLVTQIIKETIISTLEPIEVDGTLQPMDLDQKYFDGIIVITQFYTFLGNGLHEKAFDLFSSKEKNAQTKEDYVKMAALNFKSVQIISIVPYFYDISQRGGRVKPDPENIARFAVYIRAWGEGNMSGSRINGELQYLFLELIKENAGWKINAFATAPFP